MTDGLIRSILIDLGIFIFNKDTTEREESEENSTGTAYMVIRIREPTNIVKIINNEFCSNTDHLRFYFCFENEGQILTPPAPGPERPRPPGADLFGPGWYGRLRGAEPHGASRCRDGLRIGTLRTRSWSGASRGLRAQPHSGGQTTGLGRATQQTLAKVRSRSAALPPIAR